jgi:hypothetical protein
MNEFICCNWQECSALAKRITEETLSLKDAGMPALKCTLFLALLREDFFKKLFFQIKALHPPHLPSA